MVATANKDIGVDLLIHMVISTPICVDHKQPKITTNSYPSDLPRVVIPTTILRYLPRTSQKKIITTPRKRAFNFGIS